MLRTIITTFALLCALALQVSAQPAQSTEFKLRSPDKKLEIGVKINSKGRLSYSVKRTGKPVLHESKLGLQLKSIGDFDSGWRVSTSKRSSFSERWTAVWGPDKVIDNTFNQLAFSLQDAGRHKLNLYFRAFNNGIAFRYEIPAQTGISAIDVTDELTEFHFAEDAMSWSIPQNFGTDEDLYRKQPLSAVQSANTPITLSTNWYAASIHEAALVDYAQMTLTNTKDKLTLKADLVPWPDGIKVRAKGSLVSPWRVVQLTDTPAQLIASHIIQNLNPPCKITDVSWIKPGKYIGIWWEMHLGASLWYPTDTARHGATTAHMKEYIDFAAKNNIQAVLAEGWNTGWETRNGKFSYTNSYPDYDLPVLANYAHNKGVDIIVHNETRSDIPSYEAQMEKAFAYYQKLGIHYIKSGYISQMVPAGMLRHSQFMVRHYRKVIECAARHHIMLDVHEPIMDTGESRTFPNMMTREGVRGMEFEAWSTGNPPSHVTTLPFTRMLAGPLDYNPGVFDVLYKNSDPKKLRKLKLQHPEGIVRVHTTLTAQLALSNILYSPIQMAPDLISNYEGQPAFQFIRDLKTSWDETRVIDGKIGEYVLLARRCGSEWFVSAITNESARQLQLDLSFLKNGNYSADVYQDSAGTDWLNNPAACTITKESVDASSHITLNLPAGGGYCMKIYPNNN